jgi:predicted TPR repeat methyltransferase
MRGIVGAMNPRMSQSGRQALVKAVELRAKGKLAEAESTLRQLLRADAKMQPALHLLGLIRHERGDDVDAQKLIERAVSLAPGDIDAWRNLGNICQDSGAVDRARACFRTVLQLQPNDIAARGNLVLLLEAAGQFDEAIGETRQLLHFAPNENSAMRILARLLRQTRRHEEEVVVVRELVRRFPGDDDLKKSLSRSYFLWFDSVDRDPVKAQEVLAEWNVFDPDDPIARHMLAAYRQKDAPVRAENAYVERHFDEFAATFDKVLSNLGYRTPELMHEALKLCDPEPHAIYAAADLGCGTGRVGVLVRPWARSLVGVDLSQKMLDQAKTHGIYDELVHQEITAFVDGHPGAFDLILCADTLPYFGDLSPLFAGISRALRSGGRFFCTVELLDGDAADFLLHSAGRYAHSAKYVTESLTKAGFDVERAAIEGMREQYGVTVNGLVLTARINPSRAS